jgi:hypothetical protein
MPKGKLPYSSALVKPMLRPTNGMDTPCSHGVSIPLLYRYYTVAIL